MDKEAQYYKEIAEEIGKRYLRQVRKLSKIIADKKKIEQKLKLSEERYRNIFENAPSGIFETTPDGRFKNANPKLAKILGFDSVDELITSVKNIAKDLFVISGEIECLKTILESNGKIEGFETRLKRKDGKIIWVSINASQLMDKTTGSVYYEGTCEDITEKKNLQAQIFHAQKMEAIGTLTGGIAHDFNNFLTAIIGYASLAQLKIDKDTHIKKYIDQIMYVSNKMTDLVKNLLAFSRKQPVNLMPIDLNNEIKETKRLIKRVLPENIEFNIVTSDKNPIVMADKTQLSQILFNMATNARDAMPDGGKFTVKIDTTIIDETFIKKYGFGKKGEYALISISDTGIGMEKEIMDKIFDPFFTTKEQGKGTGLGLASVYGIVKQHNGYITVKSSPGNGAMFMIYLPIVNMEVKEEKKEEVTISQGTGTILIGEDDKNVRSFLKDVLEHYGYRVFEAEDGIKLLEVFKEKENIDLVITDMIMPKKGGIEAYNEITAVKKDVKFIFMSGYDKDMFSKIPVEDKKIKFILKPVSIETLLKAVEGMVKI